MNTYQQLIAASRYARYLPEHKRRETWEETCDRLIGFIKESSPELHHECEKLSKAVKNHEIMPSMRLMMSAGEACRREKIAAENWS